MSTQNLLIGQAVKKTGLNYTAGRQGFILALDPEAQKAQVQWTRSATGAPMRAIYWEDLSELERPDTGVYGQIIAAGVGAVVTLNRSFFGEPMGRGLVYEVYEITPGEPGVSILTESGRDLGGFAKDDLERFTAYLGRVPLEYDFISVSHLYGDIARGRFTQALQELRALGAETADVCK